MADIGLNSRLAVNSFTSCRETFPHNVSQVSVGSDRSIKVVVLSSGIHDLSQIMLLQPNFGLKNKFDLI